MNASETQEGTDVRYRITKRFIGGLLEGIRIVEWSRTEPTFKEGWEYSRPIGGSPYRIEEIKKFPVDTDE